MILGCLDWAFNRREKREGKGKERKREEWKDGRKKGMKKRKGIGREGASEKKERQVLGCEGREGRKEEKKRNGKGWEERIRE